MPENQKTKIAYIVVGWNNSKLLKECFESINNQNYADQKIIYVDNASSDDSAQLVKRHYPDIAVIEQAKNTGFAKGNNIGIAEALKDPTVGFVALINSDARLAPGWTKRIVKFAACKPMGACYQGTTLDYYNHDIIDSTHIYVSRNGQGTQGSWRFYLLTDMGPKKVFGVNAAACVISRTFIEAQPFGTKLFDETMYMYLEDIDLATRATLMGWDNYLVPEARAYHMGSASSGKRPGFSLYMTFRNNSTMLFKNFSLRQIVRMLPAIIRGDIDTMLTLWRRRQKSAIWQVIKGRLVGLIRLPMFIKKRFIMSRRRVVDPDYLWLLMKEGL